MKRSYEAVRKTENSEISIKIAIDGEGKSRSKTGIASIDHIINIFALHALFDIFIDVKSSNSNISEGEIIDAVGSTIGQAIDCAIGERHPMKKHGLSYVSMNGVLAMASVELTGTPFLIYEARFYDDTIGDMKSLLVEKFFRAMTASAKINAHIKLFYGTDSYCILEAITKAFGRAIDEATWTASTLNLERGSGEAINRIDKDKLSIE